MRLDLRAESQDESSAGLRGQIPGGVSQIGGRTRERNRDGRAELHSRGMFGDQRAGKKRIVLGFLSPQRVEADFFRGFCDRGDVFQLNGRQCGVKFHAPKSNMS